MSNLKEVDNPHWDVNFGKHSNWFNINKWLLGEGGWCRGRFKILYFAQGSFFFFLYPLYC